MDHDNLSYLNDICPSHYHGVLGLFLQESGVAHAGEVPDPYYGDEQHFEHAMQLVVDAVDGLFNRIKKEYAIH